MEKFNKSVLVTGGAGFIGSCFVRQLIQRGIRVTVLDALTYAGHRENLEGISGEGSMDLVVGDINDRALVSKILREKNISHVVNFAAESHVDRSISGPAAFVQTNIVGVFSLLEASLEYWRNVKPIEKKDFRFLQVSTDEVFGSLGPTGYFSETTPYAPNSPYSASKAASDHLVRAWHHTFGLPTIVTNCSNNYGPRQFPEKLIPLMIARALSGGKLPIYGTGVNVRDWIHVEDHALGIELALNKGQPGSSYCFGGRAERTNLQVVHSICEILDQLKPRSSGGSYKDLISFVADRPGHDARYAIDDTLAEKELLFRRSHTFETGLKATVQWYINNSAWCLSVEKAAKERV